jgi:energy-coupling factor transporter transmembrane protein EcfT
LSLGKLFSTRKVCLSSASLEGPAPSGDAKWVGLRMLLALTLSCLAFVARSIPFLLVLTAVNLALLWYLGNGQISLRRELKAFVWQTLVILVLYLIRFQDLSGLGGGFKISWQLFLALLPSMVFVRSTSQTRIVQALNRIMPCRMAFVLSTCLKFAPQLLAEVRSIYEGQVLRGARILPRDLVKPWHWFDLLHCVVVPAVVQSMALAGNIALAAKARDFGSQPKRSCWPGL